MKKLDDGHFMISFKRRHFKQDVIVRFCRKLRNSFKMSVKILDYGWQDGKFQRAAFSKRFDIHGGSMEACYGILPDR